MPETVYILLGSNIGDRERFLERALERLEAMEGLEVVAVSAIYITEPHNMQGENPSFLNQVVKGDYRYTPMQLLHSLEEIERDLGRIDKGENQPRTIDLDILLFGEHVIDSQRLCIPHLQLLSRPFALVPLLEIDPDLLHPVDGHPIEAFLTEEDRRNVIMYREHVARHIRA